MARQTLSYAGALDLLTSGMTYAEWRSAILAQGGDVLRVIDQARRSADVRFYNFLNEDGTRTTRVYSAGDAVPVQEGA